MPAFRRWPLMGAYTNSMARFCLMQMARQPHPRVALLWRHWRRIPEAIRWSRCWIWFAKTLSIPRMHLATRMVRAREGTVARQLSGGCAAPTYLRVLLPASLLAPVAAPVHRPAAAATMATETETEITTDTMIQ